MRDLPSDFRAGVRDITPLVASFVPFVLVVGATAVNAGFSVAQAVSFSTLVYAGAAQLAAIGLVDEGASLAVIVFTALVVNVRMLMYSASLAPYVEDESLGWRAAIAHVIIDVVYAMAIVRFEEDEGVDRRWYFLGLGVPAYVVWVLGTGAGALVGGFVPSWLPLSFVVPMVFLALVVQTVGDRATAAAGVAGAALAVIGAGLPFNLGLPVGAVVGIVAGLVVEWRAGP